VQIFKLNLSKHDQQKINRQRFDGVVSGLKTSFLEVSKEMNNTFLQHAQYEDVLRNAWNSYHTSSSVDIEPLQQSMESFKQKLYSLDNWEDNVKSDCANPLNFPIWQDNSFPDRPSRPALCFSVGYAKGSNSLLSSWPEFNWEAGAPLLADQALDQDGRVDRWVRQEEFFKLQDQGWVNLISKDFVVGEGRLHSPVAMICNEKGGNWCGGVRFGGVDFIKQEPMA